MITIERSAWQPAVSFSGKDRISGLSSSKYVPRPCALLSLPGASPLMRFFFVCTAQQTDNGLDLLAKSSGIKTQSAIRGADPATAEAMAKIASLGSKRLSGLVAPERMSSEGT